MSLHDDFGMYYNGTYIGYRQNNGKVVPFAVDAVSNDSDLFNLRNYPSHQRQAMEHGEEAYNAMVFHGHVVQSTRSRVSKAVSITEDRLVFDLPDPKYIKLDGAYYWCSYRANRSTKKGMCSRRISCQLAFTDQIAILMFDETPDENVIGRIFLRNGDKLDYKGTPVGQLNGNNVTLFTEAAHLSRVLQQEWPECQITVEPAQTSTQTG